MPEAPFFELEQFQDKEPIFDLEDIRKINPQRHAMEQLSGILWVDEVNHCIAGYKDVTEDEFWCTGHMPGFPLMPGVILCECAAQLAGFYARKYDILGGGDFLGFGGMDHVRFRAPVYPGDRLLILARVLKVKPKRRAEYEFQGFVKDKMVFNGTMIGVPINRSTELG